MMDKKWDNTSLAENKIACADSGIAVRNTICSICEGMSNCGINAYVKDGVIVKVEGDTDNPHSAGTLCAKGAASRKYVYNKDRILTPLMRTGNRGDGRFEPISWEHAFGLISDRLLTLKKESGPEATAFFVGYTKWFRPFLKRLAHSYGSPNFCTESSLCFFATQVATKLTYGYWGGADLANAKCLLVWSKNPFYTNTSNVRYLLDAKERGLKIIEVGPLITPLTNHADIHLRIRPGTSGALALGLAHVIIKENLYDKIFVENWTLGFDEYRTYVDEFPPETTAAITGVPVESIIEAARLFATTKPAALDTSACTTVHHTNGVQNHRALTTLVGLTGNFDQPGGNYVVPPTWVHVPSAAVTREHAFEQVKPFSDMAFRIGQERYPIWSKYVAEAQSMQLPFQIESGKPYPIRALVAFGMRHRMWPGSDYMLENLKKLDFFVDIDIFMTETAKYADIVLPACTSFERSEIKFYSENYVVWTQPVIAPLGESRPDTEIIFELAKRIAPDDELMQKGYEASVDWILEPTGLSVEELKKEPNGMALKDVNMPPYRKYEKAGFPTPSGKMEFCSTVLKKAGFNPLPFYQEPRLSPLSTPDMAERFPLVLTTGSRLPMYQHSRTFRLDWTTRLHRDPSLDINPVDAARRGIDPGDWVVLSTHRNSVKAHANVTTTVPPGVISIFHAWPEVDINLIIDPDYLDPISGFPGFKSFLCEVEKC